MSERSLQVEQCVYALAIHLVLVLAPIITSKDNVTFVTYQDINTPSNIRKTTLKVKPVVDHYDLQTIGGILLDTEMRSQSAIDHEDLNDDESEPVEVSDNDSETEDDEDDYHFELFSEEESDSDLHTYLFPESESEA